MTRLVPLTTFKAVISALSLLLLSQLASAEALPPGAHGEFSAGGGQHPTQLVFDDTANEWVTPEQFWRNYANAKGGITWGESDQYPNYDDVKEFDTLMIRVAQGPCLMEFFHSRWRRANDVRRWNPMFNEVLGCANVFD